MFTATVVILMVSVIVLLIGLAERSKAGRIAQTPLLRASEVAALPDRKPVSIEGPIQLGLWSTGGSGKNLIYAEMEVTANWNEGEQKKSKLLASQKTAGNFNLDDGSGKIFVDTKDGIEDLVTMTNTIDERSCLGLLEEIDQRNIFSGGNTASRLSSIPSGATFTVTSKGFYEIPWAFVCGVWDPQEKILTGGGRPLLVSSLSQSALLAKSQGRAQLLTRIGGAGLAASGVALALVRLLHS